MSCVSAAISTPRSFAAEMTLHLCSVWTALTALIGVTLYDIWTASVQPLVSLPWLTLGTSFRLVFPTLFALTMYHLIRICGVVLFVAAFRCTLTLWNAIPVSPARM